MHHGKGVQRARRRSLGYVLAGVGGTLGAGAFWIGTSRRRAARWLRQILADARRQVAAAPAKPTPNAWSDNAITISWIGHSTTLINFLGIRILTDPVFGKHIGLSLGLGTVGPKRYVAPALSLADLPPIDVVLLSHAHFDHMDLPTLRHLAPRTFTVTARATSDLLVSPGLKQITELGWNERTTYRCDLGELQIEAVEVKHWGRRWPSELARGYNGYILRREGKAILFGGDTARTPLFLALRSRGPFAAAILPIGAYDPWIRNHCTPEQAIELANQAGAGYIVPVHHRTFRLSNEPMDEPIERFVAALEREPERVALRRIGETFVCPRT